LPFRVWQIYKKMVEFVAAGDVASFVAAGGILAHYVGDACQPLDDEASEGLLQK
jgi:hypothetical protein